MALRLRAEDTAPRGVLGDGSLDLGPGIWSALGPDRSVVALPRTWPFSDLNGVSEDWSSVQLKNQREQGLRGAAKVGGGSETDVY